MEMGSRVFQDFRSLVYARSGIALGEGKEALVSARIGKRLRHLGLVDFDAYLDWVKGRDGEEEMVHLLDAISTNVTSFFREPAHFEFVAECMRKWMATGQQRFRFWSAASSTGEEPYTLAMTLRESKENGEDIRILATDISTRVLEAAKQGRYAAAKLQSLPDGFAKRYFTNLHPKEGSEFEIKEELKRMVLFKRLNLAFPPFPMAGSMDMILCRNVMIYFDNPVRKRLLEEFYRLLKPGGYLLVGHSESLTGLAGKFKTIRPSIYLK